jgi:hypothetical protein
MRVGPEEKYFNNARKNKKTTTKTIIKNTKKQK